MITNEHAASRADLSDLRLRPLEGHARERSRARTIVIRHGSAWQSLAFLCLCVLLLVAVLLGHQALRGVDMQNQQTAAAIAAWTARSSRSSPASPSTPSAATSSWACATTS